MDRKRVSNPELAALGKFQGTIDRSSNFRGQALNHNLGRNVRVVNVLTYLAKMVVDGCKLRGEVDCVAAERQNFSSPRTGTHLGLPAAPSQAAHFLPGQIRIGGQNIWELASDYSIRSRLEFLFAEVEHLPVAFNQADSAAESKGNQRGLGAAFAAACAVLIRQSDSHSIGEPPRVPQNAGGLSHPLSPAGRMVNWASMGIAHPDAPAARLFKQPAFGGSHPNSPSPLTCELRDQSGRHGNSGALGLVARGFEVWHQCAIDAFRLAAAAKREKPGLPPLEGNPFDGYTPESIARRSTAESSLWNQDDAVRILEYYLEDQQQRSAAWAESVCSRLLFEL